MRFTDAQMHSHLASDTFVEKPSAPYSIELIESVTALTGLETVWDRLSKTAPAPNVFSTFDWFRAWFTQSARERQKGRFQPHVLVLQQNGAVVGIAPLSRYIASRFGFRVRKLEFVASYADYYDFVLGTDTTGQTKAVLEFLARTSRHWDIADLRALRINSDEIARMKYDLQCAGLSYHFMPEVERCPFMLIDGPWPKIVSRRSNRTRDTFRRMQSRLEGMAIQGLRVRIFDNPHAELGLLKKMIAIEAQKRVDGKLSMPFLGRYTEVFTSLFDRLGAKGWLCVATMELGDRLLGWELIFRCGENLWSYQGAYEHNFSRLSPGTMLLPAVIDYGHSRGYAEYDFLSGEESYKLRWATGFHQTYRLLIWNRRWLSRLWSSAYLKLRVKSAAAHLKEDTPA